MNGPAHVHAAVDPGGGSTGLILDEGQQPRRGESLHLGGAGMASVTSPSGVEGLAGGIFFCDEAAGTPSEGKVKQVFDNLGGRSRDDRLRFDAPSLAGSPLGNAVPLFRGEGNP